MRRTQPRSSGFSLIEIAVVLVIVATLAGFGIATLRSTIENRLYAQTVDRQKTLKTSLAAFLGRNKRLPCPAAATAQGLEDCSAATVLRTGIIPYATLQLGREAALDGQGNFFRYTVSTAWSPAATPTEAFRSGRADGGIRLQNGLTGGALTAISTTQGVFALISFGNNGFGAWTEKGTQNSLPAAGSDERSNADLGTTTFVTAAQSETFDDVVLVVANDELLTPLIQSGQIDSPDAVFKQGIAAFYAFHLKGGSLTPPPDPWSPTDALTYNSCSAQLPLPIEYGSVSSLALSDPISCNANDAFYVISTSARKIFHIPVKE